MLYAEASENRSRSRCMLYVEASESGSRSECMLYTESSESHLITSHDNPFQRATAMKTYQNSA
jgi:hypothetical protein